MLKSFITLACTAAALLATACTDPSAGAAGPAGAAVTDAAWNAAVAFGGTASTTYQGLQVNVKSLPDGHDIGVALVPPNVVMSARVPDGRIGAIDYVVSTDQDPFHPMHVLSTEPDRAFLVNLPISKLRAGEYTVTAYADGATAPFGKAGLHISGQTDLPSSN